MLAPRRAARSARPLKTKKIVSKTILANSRLFARFRCSFFDRSLAPYRDKHFYERTRTVFDTTDYKVGTWLSTYNSTEKKHDWSIQGWARTTIDPPNLD